MSTPAVLNRLRSLRSCRLLLAGVATLSFLLTSHVAFAQASGTIRGRVLNVGNSRYVNNARVSVEGTLLEALTNEYGEYRIDGVPAGAAQVRAHYTGLDPEVATVNVTAGGTATYDFNLSSRARYGDDKTVVLDSLTVAASRGFESSALATNEQRYAPNLKVVMAADAFGDITEGNAGEFLKYLPGISVDYVAADVRTVAVRGFAANFTNVYLDGMRTTSSASGASGRIFEFEQVSINNASRVEVTKVPTADMPADALGGSVNLVSKNAFEQRGASFDYRLYLSANDENLNFFKKTPGPGNESTYKVLPGFDFTYVLPASDRFGIVVTGLNSNQFNEQHRWQTTWNHAQAGATPQNPYLQQWQIQDGPKTTTRISGSIKADWKMTDMQTLSVGVQDSYYAAFFGNRNLNFDMGTNQVPTPATGTPLIWGPTFVQSATGRGSVTRGSSFRDKLGNTLAANLKWIFNGPVWNASAGIYNAKSRTWYREITRGQFSNVGSQLQGVSIVSATNIGFPNHDWEVRNAAGQIINPYDLNNYRVTTAQNSPIDGKATMTGAYLDVRRDLNFGVMPLSIKAGVAARREDRDNRRYTEVWQFVGADGVPNTADDVATPFIDTEYNVDPYWGEPRIQWLDPYKLYDHYKANPTHFRQGTAITQAVGVTAETNRINNSEKITETVSAGYIQFDGKLLDNRLQFVAGLRWERTEDRGEGVLANVDAVFQRNPDGTYVDGNPATPGIQRVRKPEAGAAGSMEELKLTRIERGFVDTRDYDDIYPSLHLTYKFAENFLGRVSYARMLGRPDYANIIPLTTLDENDADPTLPGTLNQRNTGLRPWQGDSYDVSLEYYFDRGGVFSVGGFQKDISDFWVARPSAPLTAGEAASLGIDPRFVGWGVTTTINGGHARIRGFEFNAVRTLDFLPGIFGRYLSLSANGTKLDLSGPEGASFAGFIDATRNISLSWNQKPISARVTWNYRGRQRGSAYNSSGLQTGAQYGATTGFYEYFAPRYNIDVNLEYTFSRRVELFLNARNITNKAQRLERYSEQVGSADYARGFREEEFGVQYTLGVKGRW